MLGWLSAAQMLPRFEAVFRSHAVIWFKPDGTVKGANDNFCKALGYKPEEIVGQHHRMFLFNEAASSDEYKRFWSDLAAGKPCTGQFRRRAKDGSDVWIEATYEPVLSKGKVIEVLKIAADITATKNASLHNENKLTALERSLAVIEFNPDGNIVEANENFCSTMGYELAEIRGRSHAIFCDSEYARSEAYCEHWGRLQRGEFIAGTFNRIGKNGKSVWIQASYNPVFDAQGKIYRVIKFATDITARMHSIEVIGKVIGQISRGDLSRELVEVVDPSMERTKRDLNEAISNLGSTLSTVLWSSSEIAEMAAEMQTSAQNIAHRTEQQAASVEETAAALEEMTQTVADANNRAAEAGRLVQDTRRSAEVSGNIVTQAVTAMDEIASSSRAISNIISVIDEIAFQTNLLALNAGVEAARAGEAGKGFAVVAQEVRELAQRSASAAKEIKGLIGKSSQHVANGVELVAETGKALIDIVGRVQEIDQNVTAIVESSKEQAAGIRSIGQAVNVLDQSIQQNAATVEQQSTSSDELANKAHNLANLLSQFQVADSRRSSSNNVRTLRTIRSA